ncbi:MAG: transporter [Mesorhizobium sp.]
MPSVEDIQQYMTGAWRLMLGKPDGMRLLDISVDGFWNSFFAIIVALPALAASWIAVANDITELADMGSRLSIVLRFAVVDIGAWVLPLGALALAARPAGIADRLVHYVVATNWGSALLVWLMLPPAVLKLFFPAAQDVSAALSLLLFLASMVLSWRLTNAAIGKGAGLGSAVFVAMFVASLAVLFALQAILGLGRI